MPRIEYDDSQIDDAALVSPGAVKAARHAWWEGQVLAASRRWKSPVKATLVPEVGSQESILY